MSTSLRHRIPITAFLILFTAPALAYADLITYSFTATVTAINEDRAGVLAHSGIDVRTDLLGTVTWDDEAPACFNADCTDFYNRDKPLAWLELSYGAYWLSAGGIQILRTSPSAWIFDWGSTQGTTGYEYVLLDLFSSAGHTAPITGEPLTSFDPNIFDTGTLHAAGSYAYHTDFNASVSNIQPVPEAPTWVLVACGAMCIAAGRSLRLWGHTGRNRP